MRRKVERSELGLGTGVTNSLCLTLYVFVLFPLPFSPPPGRELTLASFFLACKIDQKLECCKLTSRTVLEFKLNPRSAFECISLSLRLPNVM